MMDVKEAEKFWCIHGDQQCITNDCMAWRWDSVELRTVGDVRSYAKKHGLTEREVDEITKPIMSRTRGYCGLAGKP